MFSSLKVEIEENNHCVSPEGRVEERGGIGEDELLFLKECLITKYPFIIVFNIRND